MKILQNGVTAVENGRTEPIAGAKITNAQLLEKQSGFNELLNAKIIENQPLQFSKHANMRLSARDIALSGEQMQRVEEGVNKARAKGIKDSLVFVDNVALLVNIRSKTVITAMQTASGSEDDRVFTNIDGAVIV